MAALTLLPALAACSGNSESASTNTSPGTHQHSGTAANAAALPLRTGERFQNLGMSRPYTPAPPAGGTDDYRCMVIDPKLTAPAYLTGSQFEPQNPAIAHHAIIFVVSPEHAAEARAKDAAAPGEGYTCFGNDGLQGSAWVDVWTPGGKETLLDRDAGYAMKPGSLIVLQVHYNLLASGGKAVGSDQSSVRLRLTDGTANTVPLTTTNVVAPIELPCPAGETGPLCDRDAAVADVAKRSPGTPDQAGRLLKMCSGGKPQPGNTQSCDKRIPAPMTVYATRGHMHLLGRSIKIELNPGTATAQTLLDVPSFDFDNQALQILDRPVHLKAGDKVRLTCTHDASLRARLPQLKTLPPRYVVWGEGTSDEMCLGIMTTSPDA
ncbi:monooxygenase [Mangrovihabitans endophyticus]|uniref:Copper type II ascorbate-dependent monooxygenase C-terminal domain-containing protein n=1 Tax=Mangrovihabitans endophyticus TaxID=1751298 RepID=A0A8J3BXV9_9ACTN|nr:monooxygenase [Mangrovihabitans endophyticus]GGK81878.1 hypothetical protein GCM10012284_14920 [Mangrovihabitans endophyticus]